MFPCCCAQPESEHFLLSCMVGMRYDSLYIADNDGTVLEDAGATLYEAQVTPVGLFALRGLYPSFWTPPVYTVPTERRIRFRLAEDTAAYASTDVLANRTECSFPGYAAQEPYAGNVSSCRDLCPPVYLAGWLGATGSGVRRWWHPTLDCLVQWSTILGAPAGYPFDTVFGQREYIPYVSTDEEDSHTIRGFFLNWTGDDPPYSDCLAQYKLKYPVTLTPEGEGGAYSNWYGITMEHRAYVEPINMAEGCLPAPFNQSLAVLADHPDRHLNHLAITDQGLRAMALTALSGGQIVPYVNDYTPSSHSVVGDFTLPPVSAGCSPNPATRWPELGDTWVHDEGGNRKGSIYSETLRLGSDPSDSRTETFDIYGWVMLMTIGPASNQVVVAAARFPDGPYTVSHSQWDPFIVNMRLRFDIWEHFSDEETDRNCPYGTTSAGLMAPEDMDADAAPYETKECYAVWTDPTSETPIAIRLHTADPGIGGGASQYSGGSYSELYPSWDAASGGYRAMTSPLVSEGVASEAVTWASLWAYDWDLEEYVWIGNAELQGDTAFGLDDKLTMLAGSTKYAVP